MLGKFNGKLMGKEIKTYDNGISQVVRFLEPTGQYFEVSTRDNSLIQQLQNINPMVDCEFEVECITKPSQRGLYKGFELKSIKSLKASA